MPTTITKTLKSSGGDYTTIKAWIADTLISHPDLVSADVILQLNIFNDFGTPLAETFVSWDAGLVTSATNFIQLTVLPAERHDGRPGTGFEYQNSSTGNGLLFLVRGHYIHFDGFELSSPLGGSTMFFQPQNSLISNAIIHDQPILITQFATFENVIVYNIGDGAHWFDQCTLTNVTLYAESTNGDLSGDRILRQCDVTDTYLHFDHTKVTFDAIQAPTGGSNIAAFDINGDWPDKATTGVLITDDSDLVNPSIDDYRIKNTSSLKTAGTSGGRIGAFFEPEVIGGVTIPVIMNHLRNQGIS